MQQELIILISKIADEISESVSVGTGISIDGNEYEVVEIQINVSRHLWSRYLAVNGGRVIYGSPSRSWYEIGGEIRTLVESADREDYLFFANNWLQIIRAFDAEEDKIIERLRQEFPNSWNPWDESVYDDEIDENKLVKERCEQIINAPNSSDKDKEEARATLALCELLLEGGG